MRYHVPIYFLSDVTSEEIKTTIEKRIKEHNDKRRGNRPIYENMMHHNKDALRYLQESNNRHSPDEQPVIITLDISKKDGSAKLENITVFNQKTLFYPDMNEKQENYSFKVLNFVGHVNTPKEVLQVIHEQWNSVEGFKKLKNYNTYEEAQKNIKSNSTADMQFVLCIDSDSRLKTVYLFKNGKQLPSYEYNPPLKEEDLANKLGKSGEAQKKEPITKNWFAI